MHPVFSHDLPNQLVVIQSLASLMTLEEKDALGTQAREYLTRLTGAAKRASNMVQFLKQMARLQQLDEPIETVQVAHLGREIRAGISQLFPGRTFTFDMQWQAPAFPAGRRTLHQALMEALRCGIEWCADPLPCLRFASRPVGPDVELDLEVVSRDVGASSPAVAPRDRPTAKNRLELRLAQELVATWGGTIELPPETPNFLMRLFVPSSVC